MLSFKKNVISHSNFYLCQFERKPNRDYLIYIHGGPGNNCGILEYLIEQEELFKSLDYNIILYDQRTCGRSTDFPEKISHENNVNDLQEIYQFFLKTNDINIKGFIGHSYGAKLLFDFYKKFSNNIPGVFVSTANSILIPRLNNLLFDLAYLKKIDVMKYKKIYEKMNNENFNNLWELTEELSYLFEKNSDRKYLYWADLDWLEKVQKIQDKIDLPTNAQTFMEVRRDLYSADKNFSVDLEHLQRPFLWINGLHDFIMNGTHGAINNQSSMTTFYKSSHYPHIEENERFCQMINTFIKKCWS